MSQLAADVVAGSRTALSRAITLVESTRADHRLAARALLAAIAEHAGGAVRVGISGTPGVGKSTFIEALGSSLTAAGHRVGVLAVDPSSVRTGGSVLGDKTRMPQLAADPNAYIRPSPTAGTLGGVARATAQTITLLEAGGYDVVLVETVGVGQSETTVAGMVDTFLLLGLARAGDQLQGIKKGVLEIADVVAINKADGEHALAAKAAARELAGALRLVHSGGAGWVPPVLTCSALTGDGVTELWATDRQAPRVPRPGRPGGQAIRPAVGAHLGAGPGRAGPAAAPVGRGLRGGGRGAGRCAHRPPARRCRRRRHPHRLRRRPPCWRGSTSPARLNWLTRVTPVPQPAVHPRERHRSAREHSVQLLPGQLHRVPCHSESGWRTGGCRVGLQSRSIRVSAIRDASGR